jgi:hypothetical protein
MKLRTAVLGGTAAGVIAVAYWLLRSPPSPPPAAASRPSKATTRSAPPALEASATPASSPAPRPAMVMTESGLRPQTARKPREWIDPVSGAMNRELLDAVPDPESDAREELKYRKSRLRFVLADAAAPCWTGADSKEEIELEYTLVVEKEMIRTDNVRVKTSSITDPTVQRCMIDAVRGLQSPAYKIPDLREDQGLFMSLHDLYDRNERAAKDKAPQDDR